MSLPGADSWGGGGGGGGNRLCARTHVTSAKPKVPIRPGVQGPLNCRGGGGFSTHIMVGMCHRKVTNGGGGGGSGTSSRVKMGVSGTHIGHSGIDFVGIRGVSGTRYCENARALPMDVWLAAGGVEM